MRRKAPTRAQSKSRSTRWKLSRSSTAKRWCLSKVEEIEARRAARKAESSKARDAQYEKDLEAFEALEIEHGDGCVARLSVRGFVPGLPTFAVVKSPGGTSFYKRYTDMVRRAQKNTQAI